MTDPTETKVSRRAQTIPQDRLLQAEFAANTWRLRPYTDTAIESILSPAYWAHVSSRLQSGELIQVIPEDRAYFAELLVLDCGRTWAKVALLRKVDLVSAKEPEVEVDGYTIKWRAARKFSVVRDSDKQVLSEDHATKESALAWLADKRAVLTA